MLPENAHKLCSKRLGLSLTRLWSFENMFVSEFYSRQDLIDAVSAGCFIPIWSGSLAAPKFRGDSCVDGAYSDNKPKFATKPGEIAPIQVKVSPFSGEIDVAPTETSGYLMRMMGVYHHASWRNAVRSMHAIFPASTSHYKLYLLEGHQNMKDYLLGHNLIRCRRCHLLMHDSASHAPACLLCLLLIERVDSLRVPEELIRIMEDD